MAFHTLREQEQKKLEYRKFDIKRGLRIKHKLHGHICIIKKKNGRDWTVLDLKNKDSHHVTDHTLYRYYDPIQ